MAEGKKIRIKLNKQQIAKIRRKIPDAGPCTEIEVDPDDLVAMVKYESPQICIDFDDEQEEIIRNVFPNMECDFATISRSELVSMLLYMPPPSGKG